MVESKKRLKYLDAMRAFTMFLVVMQHVDTSVLPGFYLPIHKILILVRMPMFFFISGYIGYKAYDYWTRDNYVARLKKKAFVQLVPASIFFVLGAMLFGQDPVALFAHTGFGKYWFTYVLFYMFCIYFTMSYAFRRLQASAQWLSIALLALSMLMWLFYVRSSLHHLSNAIWSTLFANRLCHYFVFFVAGMHCRKHQRTFHRIVSHPLGICSITAGFAGCIVIIFGLLMTTRVNAYFNYAIQQLITCLLGIIVVYAIFYGLRNVLDNGSRVSNALAFAGRRTLDVYLLHYFFIPRHAPYLAFDFAGISSTWANVLISIGMTLVIYALCLGVSRLIRFSPTLAHWMLGANKQ